METRHFPVILIALVATLALLAAACGDDTADVTTGPDGPDSTDGDGSDAVDGAQDAGDSTDDGSASRDVDNAWQLTSGTVDGETIVVPDGYRITMTLDGDQIGGVAACNSYGGSVAIDDGSFSLGEISWTEMGCEPDVTAAEQVFLSGLQRVTAIAFDGDDIVVTGDGVELRFTELPPPPTAELVDTAWELDTIIDGEAASSVMGEATLELRADGTLAGSTGCRTLTGTWQESGDTIITPELAADGDCPDELARQDGHVIEVLEGPFQASIDGQRLTLTAPGQVGLGLRAAN